MEALLLRTFANASASFAFKQLFFNLLQEVFAKDNQENVRRKQSINATLVRRGLEQRSS